jgi:hypothetical protein
MSRLPFDWRWLMLIGLIVVLANARVLPWPIVALTLGGVGGWLLWQAWQLWDGGGRHRSDQGHVTYWRGQRIERPGPPQRLRPATWPEIAPLALAALFGGALLLAGFVVVLRAFGM